MAVVLWFVGGGTNRNIALFHSDIICLVYLPFFASFFMKFTYWPSVNFLKLLN